VAPGSGGEDNVIGLEVASLGGADALDAALGLP